MQKVTIDYREIEEFLYREAELLDEQRYEEWLEFFAEDATYEIPMTLTRARFEGEGVSEEFKLMDETKQTLRIRIERLGTQYAWAEDPPSRVRHFISNIRIRKGDADEEVKVRCNLLVTRNRRDQLEYDLFSADRQDVLRRVGDEWKIARRRIILDQRNINSRNFSIFL